MTSDRDSKDFEVLADELTGQVRSLVDVGDQTNGLVSSAGRLAEHRPLLGTAPPALHLAARLREAAGPAGLTGEVSAADTELASYHRALRATVDSYQDGDREVAWKFTEGETAG
ncbi:hypothetical protein [Actinophytocola algeriensis]|uniref:Excreted virulence factor EspC (Type VII ESX diderm) n=1 Tax=Actinophytocola algeriensis TaxID=1768010 RepID=A0A7W7QEN6_9PSEU|nr:hypothetical protein [Actinophytocola algeriensis]MBB4911726.1 hypothetical protein [Actinophytocola algeriensis]MBE1473286.1 hypothetical protein [Actinophytocola algeriensis]